jgi:hypothetical protein
MVVVEVLVTDWYVENRAGPFEVEVGLGVRISDASVMETLLEPGGYASGVEGQHLHFIQPSEHLASLGVS